MTYSGIIWSISIHFREKTKIQIFGPQSPWLSKAVYHKLTHEHIPNLCFRLVLLVDKLDQRQEE